MPFDTPVIAVCLAIFFLVAALINTIINRARRRKIENQRAAQTGGGTEEAPIHLTTPFSDSQVAAHPSPFTHDGSIPQVTPIDPAATTEQPPNKDDEYVWE